jgi:hypothetical protein
MAETSYIPSDRCRLEPFVIYLNSQVATLSRLCSLAS